MQTQIRSDAGAGAVAVDGQILMAEKSERQKKAVSLSTWEGGMDGDNSASDMD